MDTPQMIILAAVAVVVVLALAYVVSRRQREQSRRLRDTYGPEYDRAVSSFGGKAKAERELTTRQRRFEKAGIRALSAADRDRYTELWRGIQARFVDNPSAAIGEADYLVGEVMRVRGYPTADDEQRLADVAIGHPHLLNHYRSANEVARKNRTGRAETEDLRQAVIHYRALFEDLLSAEKTQPAPSRR